MTRDRSLETSAEINLEALLIKMLGALFQLDGRPVGDGDGRLIALHFRDESTLDKRCHIFDSFVYIQHDGGQDVICWMEIISGLGLSIVLTRV